MTTVVLPQAFRPSITNLTRIDRLIETTTARLASGLKVNSALDNPQNFFAAQSLNDEASDLNRRIDKIGQDIQTIQTASDGIEAIQNLIAQAQSLTLEAIEEFNSAETIALVSGNVDLSLTNDITNLTGVIDGQTIEIIVGDGAGGTNTATLTLNANTSGNSLAAIISNLSDANGQDLGIRATLNESGQLQVRSTTGDFFRFEASAGTADLDTLTGLGLGDVVDQFGNFTALTGNELRSQRLFTIDDGNVASSVDRLRTSGSIGNIRGEDGNTFSRIRSTEATSTDFYFIGVNGGLLETFTFFDEDDNDRNAVNFAQIAEEINLNTNLNGFIEASFNEETGQFILTPTSSDTTSISLRLFEAGGNNLDTAFGFGTGALDQRRGIGGTTSADSFVFGAKPPELTERLNADLAEIQTQIDAITQDANYRGTNLLRGESLESIFNIEGTSRLTTNGQDFTARGLNLTNISLSSIQDANAALTDLREAQLRTRDFGATLSTNFGILQTRNTFTSESILTRESGADDLTVADSNREGADLLALQTRQALATTALSLAQQSQQSVLRLF